MPVVTRARKKTMTCSRCGKVADIGAFYASSSETNKYFEKTHVCKDCVEEIYADICEFCKERKDSIIRLCSALDIPFSDSVYDNATNWYVKQPNGTPQFKLATKYISFINSSLGKNQGRCFYESEHFGKVFGDESEDYSILKDKNKDLDNEIYNLRIEISELKESKESAEIQAARREKEKESALEKMNAAIESNRQIRELNQQINESIKQATDQNRQLNETNKQLAKDALQLKSQNEELQSKVDSLQTNLDIISAEKDSVKSELSIANEEKSKILSELDLIKSSVKQEPKEIIPEQYIFDWGEGFELKEYEYLNKELADWKSKNESDNGAQDILSREICVGKLNIRRKRSKGDDTSKDVAAIQSLIRTGNFVPKKNETQDAAFEIPWGVQMKDVEDFSPAEWIKDKKKFKDMDGISHYIKDHIIRSLKNFVTGSRDFDPGMDILNRGDSDGE